MCNKKLNMKNTITVNFKILGIILLSFFFFLYYYNYRPVEEYQIYNYINEDTTYITPEEWWIKTYPPTFNN